MNEASESNNRLIHIAVIIYAALVILFSVIFIVFASSQGFWSDELFNIGVISHDKSFADMLYIYITDEVTNPPLYTIFLYFWYRIVPYGEVYLLFPNVIFWLIGTMILMRLMYYLTDDILSPAVVLAFSTINPGFSD